jgi:hypothetical protein
MAISNRYEVAKQAAIKVIDTLIFSDWASVVLFDSSLVIYNDVLIQMTDENKQLMKEWLELHVIHRGNFLSFWETGLYRPLQGYTCLQSTLVIRNF